MKYMIISICCFFVFSCNDPFVKHALKYEKMGDCSGKTGSIKMISNINGERYEFLSCLDEGFDGKQYSVVRTGDSLIVTFPRSADKKKVFYKLILDIDAKPRYNHIILDGQGVILIPSTK